jgi:hypothetical protein
MGESQGSGPWNEHGGRVFARMHLIEIFLPLHDNHGAPFSADNFAVVRQQLAEQFGGLTAFTRAPAEGTEKDGGQERREPIVVFEVMTERLDEDWWSNYRQQLENRFKQHRILIRASDIFLL